MKSNSRYNNPRKSIEIQSNVKQTKKKKKHYEWNPLHVVFRHETVTLTRVRTDHTLRTHFFLLNHLYLIALYTIH